MAFQMVHMEIAYRVMEKLGIQDNREEFILGSVSPDSIHMREDYNVELKVHSHLFEGCGPWGDTQDYSKWIENMYRFLDTYGKIDTDNKNRMLIYGIFAHCKTDYWNDLKIWRRAQKEFLSSMGVEKFKKEYYQEAKALDVWLYQNSEHTEEIRQLLSLAKEEGFADYYSADDVVKMKKHLLDVQYNVPSVDVNGFIYYPKERLQEFLADVTEDICKELTERIGMIA